MKDFCVFHRGININGIRIKMKDLAAAFISMGYLNVKTILASGNVVISTKDSQLSLQDHKEKIEMELSMYFGYEAYVILKDLDEINALIIEASNHVIPEDHHHYLLLTNDKSLPEELRQVFDSFDHLESEAIIKEPFGIYWIVPKGHTLDSNFGKKVLGKKSYKSRLTSRNINTIKKVQKELESRTT